MHRLHTGASENYRSILKLLFYNKWWQLLTTPIVSYIFNFKTSIEYNTDVKNKGVASLSIGHITHISTWIKCNLNYFKDIN